MLEILHETPLHRRIRCTVWHRLRGAWECLDTEYFFGRTRTFHCHRCGRWWVFED